MKMSKEYKPEVCASKDVTRIHINSVYLDVEAKKAVATDGHMLVTVPVDIEPGDTTGNVPTDALKAARKLASKSNPVSVLANGACKLDNGASYPRPDARFPQWTQVVPSFREGEDGIMSISFNAELLAKLAEALGNEKVTLTFDPNDACSPIVVRPKDASIESDPLGVLMPIGREEKRDGKQWDE